jgi:hypothetical protein
MKAEACPKSLKRKPQMTQIKKCGSTDFTDYTDREEAN